MITAGRIDERNIEPIIELIFLDFFLPLPVERFLFTKNETVDPTKLGTRYTAVKKQKLISDNNSDGIDI